VRGREGERGGGEREKSERDTQRNSERDRERGGGERERERERERRSVPQCVVGCAALDKLPLQLQIVHSVPGGGAVRVPLLSEYEI